MATAEWLKPPPEMAAEAIATLAVLVADTIPAAAMAGRITIAAHQIPELVEAGTFRAGDLDDDAMAAMAVVVDIAAGWDDEEESVEEFVADLDEHDLIRLGRAARLWAQAVWATMVPLDADAKATLLDQA